MVALKTPYDDGTSHVVLIGTRFSSEARVTPDNALPLPAPVSVDSAMATSIAFPSRTVFVA